MSARKSFYVTTPIYYVNDAPHIGHAYTTVAGDVLARWHRQRQEPVWYLTGTDEHGTKVERTANENDMSPNEWVDKLVEESWRPVLEAVNASTDDFIRTTSGRHRRGVSAFWQRLKDNGYVYEAAYEGPYCVGCEEFKSPGDLVENEAGEQLCPIHGRPVELIKENNWWFKLSAFSDALQEHYRRNPQAIEPRSAYNEVMAFISRGLSDISMSRSSVKWGVPLPWDSEQVVYVWFDALLNYITALGYGSAPGTAEAERFANTWPADVHLVGKDILRFHAVYWPAMLMAAELDLPGKVFAHGWLLVGGEKMSKSKLTGIAPDDIISVFGVDAFRYYFMRAINFGADGSFSYEDMHARYTSELANGLGNLASRATAMVVRYCDGVLPEPGPYSNADRQLQDSLIEVTAKADEAMGALDFSNGIAAIRSYVEAVNVYVTEQEPWALAKSPDDRERLHTVLYTMCEALRAIAVLYHPVMPTAMDTLWSRLGALPHLGPLGEQDVRDAEKWGQLPPGAVLAKASALFPRIQDDS